MTLKDCRILDLFAARVRTLYPSAQVWAFGSRARGDAEEQSDLDICVVVEDLDTPSRNRISDLAWEVGFENDVLIATVKFSLDSFSSGPLRESPLVKTILREGVAA